MSNNILFFDLSSLLKNFLSLFFTTHSIYQSFSPPPEVHAKLLFRGACALFHLGERARAMTTIQDAHKLSPTDKLILKKMKEFKKWVHVTSCKNIAIYKSFYYFISITTWLFCTSPFEHKFNSDYYNLFSFQCSRRSEHSWKAKIFKNVRKIK